MGDTADFSGYATKAGLKCTDGRTIMPDAFKHMHDAMVPLVWQHGHNTPANVLGHAVLESRDDGVYAYGYFNDTKQGQDAKLLVSHGDIKFLSIWANQLVERSKQVFHGMIREVSLVLAGANPGAFIDTVNISHTDGSVIELEDEVIIHSGLPIDVNVTETPSANINENVPVEVLVQADGATVQEIWDKMTEDEKSVVYYMMQAAVETSMQENAATHSDGAVSTETESGQPETETTTDDALAHKEGTVVPRNMFEQADPAAVTGADTNAHVMSHSDMKSVLTAAQRLGSMKDAVHEYALKHGIDNVDLLFPDAKTLTDTPEFDKRRTEWVSRVLNGTRHTPFSRVKTLIADLTQDEARAKGYIKGAYKNEEWFGVSKRTTTPTTIYKKQKLDRDDIVDITDFDVVVWVKGEMRLMLEEELARAILISDGRDVSHEDKIKDPIGAADGAGIRSIVNDHELYVTTVNVNVDDANSSYDEVVDAVMNAMEYYKGTGTPDFYCTIRTLNKFLQVKDTLGRRLYSTKADVAAALNVRDIITVEPMNNTPDLIGVIVNLEDYNIGADRGGEVNMFDDFDIDYNKQTYLIETRLSGALVKPKAALVIKKTAAATVLLSNPTAPTMNDTTFVVTIPTMANVVYKNADTAATLTAGAQAALTAGQRLNVIAVPAPGYAFANNQQDQWSFFRRA